MCLTAVDKKPMKISGIGYKLAEMKNGKFLSCDYVDKIGLIEYPLNTWIADNEDYSIKARSGQPYRTGFHVSLSEDPIKYLKKRNSTRIDNIVAIKCQFRKVVASDTESSDPYGPVVVAREIMNLGKIT